MRTRQVRPEKLKFEFELYISKQYDSVLEDDYILFKFITTKIFQSFVYKINVTPKIDLENKKLDFLIEGLSAPVITIAASGNAVFEYKLFGFKNTEYDLIIRKLYVDKSNYKIKISKNGVRITKKPTKLFLKVEV